MNKILHINLGGYALTIDDDAFEYLQSYLDNIKGRFSESDGRDEIMRDVESRLGELITQYLGQHSIVMLPHVESAVEIMGKPEDFGGEPAAPKSKGPFAGASVFGQSIKTGKKLFRDEDDAVIGGLCSGLATYFGIADPLWMRIIFVLLTFVSAGFWIPVYLLLWIIVPPARTAGDRLTMKGEPVNVDSIAREFEKGYERISQKMKDTAGSASFNSGISLKPAAGCLSVIGKIFLGFLILIAISMVLGLGSAWVAGIFAFFTAQPYLEYFSPLSTGLTYFGAFAGFMVFGLPVVGLCLWIARTVFQFQTPRWLGAGMGIFWTFSFLTLIGLGFTAARKLRSSATITKNVDMSGMPSDTLRVNWAEPMNDHADSDWPWDDANIYINNERLEMRDFVRIRVRRSTSGKFECRQEIYARGSGSAEATDNANQTNFNTTLMGNELKVSNKLTLEKGSKWWVRNVTIYVYVPDGKSIVFDEKIHNYAAADLDEYADGNDDNYISRSPNMVYRMTPDGLICTSCPSFGDDDYRSDRSYESFILEGDFETEIRKSDEFSVKIEGDKDGVQIIRTGDKLTLTTNGKATNGKVKVLIGANTFTELYADNTGPVTIRGFEEGRASITAKGKSAVKAYLDVSNSLEVLLSGESTLDLSGDGGELEVTLNDSAKLEASNWKASSAQITASDNSKARVYGRDRVKIKSSDASDVKVEGSAEVERD